MLWRFIVEIAIFKVRRFKAYTVAQSQYIFTVLESGVLTRGMVYPAGLYDDYISCPDTLLLSNMVSYMYFSSYKQYILLKLA